jgi:sRNA-binding protein
MHEGIHLLAELYPRCFCSTNRRPLKIGVYEEVISQHPEMRRRQIKRLLKEYIQSPEYWSTLTAGAPRVDLHGNVAGEVTAADEEDAKRKIANAARAAVKVIEDGKAKSATAPDLPSSPVAAAPQPTSPGGPTRLGLAGLKAAAQARRARLHRCELIDRDLFHNIDTRYRRPSTTTITSGSDTRRPDRRPVTSRVTR